MQEREILVHQEAEKSELETTFDTMECSKISLEAGVPPENRLRELGTMASQMLGAQPKNPLTFTQNIKKVEDVICVPNISPMYHELDLIKSTVSQTDSSNNHTKVYKNPTASLLRQAEDVSTNRICPAHIIPTIPKDKKVQNDTLSDTKKVTSNMESTSVAMFSDSHLQNEKLSKDDFCFIGHRSINMEIDEESVLGSLFSQDGAQNTKSDLGCKASITEMLTSICSLSLIFGYILWRIKKVNASPKFQIYIITFGSGLLLYLSDLVSDILNGFILILVKGKQYWIFSLSHYDLV